MPSGHGNNFSCYFTAAHVGSPLGPLAPQFLPRCSAQSKAQCADDHATFRTCPIVHSHARVPPPRDADSCRLLEMLHGRKVAILGDSMGRQLFSVLVGMLRAQTSFLDHSSWHPTRYMLWLARGNRGCSGKAAAAAAELRESARSHAHGPDAMRSGDTQSHAEHAEHAEHDMLDLFFMSNTSIAPSADWSSKPTMATMAAAGSASGAAGHNGGGHKFTEHNADVVVDWLLLPKVNKASTDNAFRLLRSAAAARPYDAVLVFIPAAWHSRPDDPLSRPPPISAPEVLALLVARAAALTATENATLSARVLDEWANRPYREYWWAWTTELATYGGWTRTGTRFAAITMPLERLDCSRAHRIADRLAGAPTLFPSCAQHGCCRVALQKARNELRGMPSDWTRIDWANLTRTAPPLGVRANWHYECQMLVPGPHGESGVRMCAEDAMRLAFDRCAQRLRLWYAELKSCPAWVARENGDCSESGNRQLWSAAPWGAPELFSRNSRGSLV
jgi:hypothetical protein